MSENPTDVTSGADYGTDADAGADVNADPDAEDGPADSHGDPVLRTRSVAREFGDALVLDGVDLTLGRGSVVGLVGPNGSGKTTLLRVLAGLLAPTRGTVERAVDAERPVGYLPQSPSFRERFTVSETLRFYADLTSATVDVRASLERVGMADVADRRVEALSGGMVRLLGVAQATVGDPPLLVLDEPTSGLDPEMAARIFSVVADLGATGTTVVLATHDLGGVDAVADAVVLLNEGTVEAIGPPTTLQERTGTDSLRAAFSALIERADVGVQGGRGRDA
ncbi:MAG: ABC transporter ATP-binding protein [Haloarculaceae archaeon]